MKLLYSTLEIETVNMIGVITTLIELAILTQRLNAQIKHVKVTIKSKLVVGEK